MHELGHEVIDLGANGPAGVDYPDFAIPVAEAVSAGQVERGILICATGHGMCIAANKVAGVRAANCRDVIDAELSRRHNDANIMCLSADLIGEEQIDKMVAGVARDRFRRRTPCPPHRQDHALREGTQPVGAGCGLIVNS